MERDINTKSSIIKGKTQFLEWCKTNQELSDFDIEMIENDLFLFPIINWEKYIHFNKSSLYEFFDSLQIHGTIQIETYENPMTYYFLIQTKVKLGLKSKLFEKKYSTRKEAEKQMFIEMFKILEEMA